jgi:hypothetical protein
MATINDTTTGDATKVDADLKNARVGIYPRGLNGGGVYSVRATTGILTAALAVDAPIFGMREAAVPTRNAYILRIDIGFGCTVAFTTGSQVGFYMERFSVANLAGGVAQTPIRYDTTYGTSELQDIRASTTAALTSAGVTFEGFKVPLFSFASPTLSQMIGPFTCFDASEAGPFRLRAGEGFCIRNLVVWPAAGTGVVSCRIGWEER